MPHFLATSIEKVDFPAQYEDITFDFCADNGSEQLISTTTENKRFLLAQRKKGDKYIVKCEKYTRVSPVSVMKKAIKAYGNLANAQISSNNLEDRKVKRSIENFKDIEFFVNDYNFDKEIWIEIGFGSGRHLLNQAKNNPNVQFIGLEIHKPSIEQVLGLIDIQGLDNVFVVDYDARLFLEFIKSNIVGKIFVHFPVPWDKRPHRRIYSKEFINEAQRVLKVGGTLELRTDSDNYYEYVTSLFDEMKLNIDIRKNQDLEVSSKYEDRWKKMEKNIYDVTFSNNEVSNELKNVYNFSFKSSINFEAIKEKVSNQPYVFDGFFVHFKSFYKINDSAGLIKVSFGSFNRPECKYLYIDNNSATYYPYAPIPSMYNNLAHQEIEKFIYE